MDNEMQQTAAAPQEQQQAPPPVYQGGGGGGQHRRSGNSFSVLVKNIPSDVHEQEMTDTFSPFGTVLDVYLPKDVHTRARKGFGFIEFEQLDSAHQAVEKMHGQMLRSNKLIVEMARHQRKTRTEMMEQDRRAGFPPSAASSSRRGRSNRSPPPPPREYRSRRRSPSPPRREYRRRRSAPRRGGRSASPLPQSAADAAPAADAGGRRSSPPRRERRSPDHRRN